MPHSIREWRGNVYKPGQNDKFFESAKWRRLRREVLLRDNYTCMRCDKRFPSDRLSVHHLVPRAEGGADHRTNLVTLDNPCHDYVEIHNLRTPAAIMGSMNDESEEAFPYETDYSEGTDPYHKEWWHKYVYGGMRRGGRK